MNQILVLLYFVLYTINSYAQQPPEPDFPSLASTEATVCEVCLNGGTPRVHEGAKIKDFANRIESQARLQTETPEQKKDRIAKAASKIIRKIKSKTCPDSSFDMIDIDSEMDFASDHLSADDFDDSRPQRSGFGTLLNRNSYSMQIVRNDPEAMEDIQDALDEKLEKCQKQMSKKRNQNSSGLSYNSQGMMNMNMNPYGSMMQNPYAMMMGLSSMLGSMPSYGSMNSFGSMSPFNSMSSFGSMSPYSMMSPYSSMSGYSSMSPYSSMSSYSMMPSYNSMMPYNSYSAYPSNSMSSNLYGRLGSSSYLSSYANPYMNSMSSSFANPMMNYSPYSMGYGK